MCSCLSNIRKVVDNKTDRITYCFEVYSAMFLKCHGVDNQSGFIE